MPIHPRSQRLLTLALKGKTRKNMASHLLKLPPELQLKIMDNLDAKSIQRLTAVCSSSKALIDEHKEMLAKNIATREFARLQSVIDYHDYSQLPFIEALSRWVARRGVWLDLPMHQPFVERWLSAREPGFILFDLMNDVRNLTRGLVWVHVQTHTPFHARVLGVESDIDSFLQEFWRPQGHVSEDDARNLYHEVKSDPTRLSADIIPPFYYRDFQGQAYGPRKRIEYATFKPKCITHKSSTRIFTSNHFCLHCTLPLPWLGHTEAFGYYAGSPKMDKLLWAASKDWTISDGERRRPLLHAAVYEAIIIFRWTEE